jgi:integrase
MSRSLIPAVPLPGALATRLAEWTEAARGAYAKATERARRVDSGAFASWCINQGLQALPADPTTVAAFLRSESEAGKSVATVRRRAASIAHIHRAAGVPNPCQAEPVRLALRAIARQMGTDQRQAAPLSARDAHRIEDRVLGDDARLKDLRDVALMMVGRDLLARASELVGLTVEAVQFEADGVALVALRRRKTSTETVTYQIGPGAAAALRRWLDAAGISSGLVFRSTTKGGNALKSGALSVRDVGRVLKALAARARFDQARVAALSGHSMRVGMACDLVAANVDSAAIMQAAGWSTPRMLTRYTQKLDAKRGAIARFYKL